MNEDFIDRLERDLEEAGVDTIPRIVEMGATAERDARLLNSAEGAVEKSRQRSLRKHLNAAVAEVLGVSAIAAMPTDQLVDVEAALDRVLRGLVNSVCDDVSRDVHNKLRLTAAVHPASHSQPTKENP